MSLEPAAAFHRGVNLAAGLAWRFVDWLAANRRQPIATACNAEPQPGRHFEPCPRDMPLIKVHREIQSKAATHERPESCQLDGHARPEAQLPDFSRRQTRTVASDRPC